MSNLSQQKRERILNFLQTIKEKNNDNEEYLQVIGEIETELNDKKYGLVWEKHEEAVDIMMKDNIPVFTEIKDKEIQADKNKKYNFLLEGDNLHSLKLLQKTHNGKIDVIYIDPPYNTKNKDFIYNDKMIGEDDGYRHSKWLSFMSERLEIAKELLTEDGVIFISIDDNEQAQLKLLCDSIFGEQNFVASMPRSTRKGGGSMSKYVSIDHDYVLFYAKDIYKKTRMYVPFSKEYLKRYKEEDEKGKFYWDTFARNRQGSSNVYTIEFPNGEKITKAWIYKEEKFKDLLTKGEIAFNQMRNGEYSLQVKQRLNKQGQIMRSEITQFPNSLGTKAIVNLLGRDVFNYAKPYELIKYLLISQNHKSATVLDFFAGSGTTGHAVMQLNKEDGGNRTYIMCTNNENKIAEEITYKRMKNIQSELPHNLMYYKTDFISKDDEDLIDLMLEHIVEMVQLERGIKMDNKEYIIVLNDSDADNLTENISKYDKLKAIYMSSDVLLSNTQKKILEDYEINIIPDYYFSLELREAGLIW